MADGIMQACVMINANRQVLILTSHNLSHNSKTEITETTNSREGSFQPSQGHEGNESAPSREDTGQQQQEQPSASHAIYVGTRTYILLQTAKAVYTEVKIQKGR